MSGQMTTEARQIRREVRTIAPLPVGFTPQWHRARAIAALA
jgi:hypothetical protein